MNNNIDKVQEVATWLGRENDSIRLSEIQTIMDSGNYYLTFWGHYSAGKSKLINNILDRDILPVQSRETTASLTYIRYGVEEKCLLYYEDGRQEAIRIEDVKQIFQNTNLSYDIEKIERMEVFLNSEVLFNGLVIVDTPGVNTIINKHQVLAINTIEQSNKIIYVLGNSPSDIDKRFIKQIYSFGVEIIFVRTKCDRFNQAEENIELALEDEKKSLCKIAEKEVRFIPVSNEKENNWYEKIVDVRRLTQEIAVNIKNEMLSSIASRIQVFVSEYITILQTEKENIEDLIAGNTEKLQKQKEDYEKELKYLEGLSSDTVKQVEKRIEDTKKETVDEIKNMIPKRIHLFKNELESLNASATETENVQSIYQEHINTAVSKIYSILQMNFDMIVKDEYKDFTDIMNHLNLDNTPPTYSEIQQDNSFKLHLYRERLIGVKDELEKTIQEHRNIASELEEKNKSFDYEEYHKALMEIEEELASIPDDIPYISTENNKIQPSQVFKMVGEVADLALFILPAGSVTKGVKAVGKIPVVSKTVGKVASGAGKLGKTKAVSKVMSKLPNLGKILKKSSDIDIIKTTDTVKDRMWIVKKFNDVKDKVVAKHVINKTADVAGKKFEELKEKRQIERKLENKGSSIFDKLSIAHWTEKLGKIFDSEPKVEKDKELIELREQTRKELAEQKMKIYNEKIRREKELNLLSDKEEEYAKREEEQKKLYESVEKEMQEREQEFINEAKAKAFNNYKVEYITYFEKNVTIISGEMIEGYFNSIVPNIVMYISSKNSELSSMIDEKHSKLERMLQEYGNQKESMKGRLNECKNYIDMLESI